jgi:hypothetical protein
MATTEFLLEWGDPQGLRYLAETPNLKDILQEIGQFPYNELSELQRQRLDQVAGDLTAGPKPAP